MKFLEALSIFLGTIIGVGIFGLPYVSSQAGFWPMVGYFILMGLITMKMNFIYGDVILGTSKIHRFPGYIGEYMGHRFKNFSFIVVVFSLVGALLAYLVIGGQFLYSFLTPLFGGGVVIYTLLFFAVGAFLVFRGVKSIGIIELFLFFVLLVILAIFFFSSFEAIDFRNFRSFDLLYFMLPYGAILFSLGGGSAIPEVAEILSGKDEKKKTKAKLKGLIVLGLIITVLIYLLFIYIVLGVSDIVSEDAFSGLYGKIDPNIIRLGLVFGVITCFTSFLSLSLTLKKVLWYDFGFSENFSWFLTSFVPLGLFFFGLRRFIEIIGFTGAVLFGLEGILLVLLYREFLKTKGKEINPLNYLLVGILVLGIVLSILLFYTDII